MYKIHKGSKQPLSKSSFLLWRIAQVALWLVGIFILSQLLFNPPLGLLIFWNILIPAAPAIFVLVPGVWRNICPMATTVLMPRHLKMSGRIRISSEQTGILNLISVLVLYTIVPLRHAVFNTNGVATFALIIGLTAIGFSLGAFFEWKSIWCSGLCPVHPVEKLYGGHTALTVPNAHCEQCSNCVVPCPDSLPNIHPTVTQKTMPQRLNALLITGGLPGFIWGWFHVSDQTGIGDLWSWIDSYKYPFVGLLITVLLYLVIEFWIDQNKMNWINRSFAAAGVSFYYWYRIPSLIGMGNYNKDGLLIDLSNKVPLWTPIILSITTTCFFFFWMVFRKHSKKSWLIRPVFAKYYN